ncbi:hypothetical protein JXJ21_12560 [candidate division KSB1 bacterium]|nr:hypothetical protein [candidate division KSB1 bacterium]
MKESSELKVKIDASSHSLAAKVFQILKDRIEQRIAIAVNEAPSGAQIILALCPDLPPEAFRIDQVGTAVRVAGGSPQGLLYGVGKFLRTSKYDGAFVPSTWRGTSTPHCSLRGMYFASHFHNWYQVAPEPEIRRYIEDLALWGVNAIKVCFPFINLTDWDDPEAEPMLEMVRRYARITRNLGLGFCISVNNTLFKGAAKQIRAVPLPDPTHRRGNSGNPICPGNPEGHAYIIGNVRHLMEQLSDIGVNYLMFWTYDEGGCACEKCMPWGSNGFLKLSRELAQVCREYFPELKTILSTWMFDTPPEGEWQGLTEAMERDAEWLDYVLADSHDDFPVYPLEIGVPGNLPLLNFPEISMWGNWPWGGYGANPLPSRLQRLWNQVKHKIAGGFPYSEGIYEDLNKIIELQFYWDRDRTARAILEEYIAYEFSPVVTSDALSLIDMLERAAAASYQKQPVDSQMVRRASHLAEMVDRTLPDRARGSWRWVILRLRAVLDRHRFAGKGLNSMQAEEALVRLIDLFHCQIETEDPYHHRVRPPLARAISRCGEC